MLTYLCYNYKLTTYIGMNPMEQTCYIKSIANSEREDQFIMAGEVVAVKPSFSSQRFFFVVEGCQNCIQYLATPMPAVTKSFRAHTSKTLQLRATQGLLHDASSPHCLVAGVRL